MERDFKGGNPAQKAIKSKTYLKPYTSSAVTAAWDPARHWSRGGQAADHGGREAGVPVRVLKVLAGVGEYRLSHLRPHNLGLRAT